MYHYKSSAELKSMAKGQLIGKYGTAIGSMLLYGVMLTAILMITMFTVPLTSAAGYIIYYLILFLVQLLIGVFSVGFAYLFLNIIGGKPYSVSDVFYGFRFHPDKAIIVSFIITVISYLVFTPYYILSAQNSSSRSPESFLIMCILYAIAQIIMTYVNMCFAIRFYILLDLPDYSAVEILKMSRRFMHGHKGRYFYICISFIPLMLLSFLSCGIGLLWVSPYMAATNAYFYIDLMQGQQAEKVTDTNHPTESAPETE